MEKTWDGSFRIIKRCKKSVLMSFSGNMFIAKSFYHSTTNTRGLGQKHGIHSNEYLQAQLLYRDHPLTTEQIALMDQFLGGHTPRHLIGPAKHFTMLDGRIPYPSRLARRQSKAMQAWFSKYWCLIYPLMIEFNDQAKNVSMDEQIISPADTFQSVGSQTATVLRREDPGVFLIRELLNPFPLPNHIETKKSLILGES